MTTKSKTLTFETVTKAKKYLEQIDKIPVSETQLARFSGFDRTRVARQIEKIEPIGIWKNAKLRPLGQCLQALLAAAKATSPADQRNQAQAEKLKLETSILSGNHIPMDECNARFAKMAAGIRDKLKSARDIPNDAKRSLFEAIRQAMADADAD